MVIHKHHLGLFSALREIQADLFASPTAMQAGLGPFLARSLDLRRSLSKHTLAGRLGYGQLGLLATTKHKEAQQNKAREAGGQVVSSGRNCYRSLSPPGTKETFSRVRQEGFIPPSLLDSTIKLFTAISRRLRPPEGLLAMLRFGSLRSGGLCN